jgi:hypothetical protein
MYELQLLRINCQKTKNKERQIAFLLRTLTGEPSTYAALPDCAELVSSMVELPFLRKFPNTLLLPH